MQRHKNQLLLLHVLLLKLLLLPHACEGLIAVEVDSALDISLKVAIQACAGLYNRHHGGSVYTYFNEESDAKWLQLLDLGPPTETIRDPMVFLQDYCLTEFPSCVLYSFQLQQTLLPNILTVAAVLEAIPIDRSTIPGACNNATFDAITEFRDLDTPYLATNRIYKDYVQHTAGLAMLSPGYLHTGEKCFNPPLTGVVEVDLIDFVFSQKLFTIFLVNACIPLTDENKLFEKITSDNPWQQFPIPVFGYARYWKVFEGDVFEAQTRCVASRNLGAIPTEVNNLSFFSTQRTPIPMDSTILKDKTNKLEDIYYDPDKTYVAFVVGDGDNVNYILNARREWMLQRLQFCQEDATSCLPLTWSISPHLPWLAPDVIEWYYITAAQTGRDYFSLPPSGHLYAYPSSLEKTSRDHFIASTEADARLLGTSSVVHWDWLTTWQFAIETVLPSYANKGFIQGIFPVNVPFSIPIAPADWDDRKFQIIKNNHGQQVVVFKPRSWRGVDGGDEYHPTSEQMAAELGNFPRGTVSYVYMTSDGGLTLENSFLAVAKNLPDHVVLVSTDTATRLASAADALDPEDNDLSWYGSIVGGLTAVCRAILPILC